MGERITQVLNWLFVAYMAVLDVLMAMCGVWVVLRPENHRAIAALLVVLGMQVVVTLEKIAVRMRRLSERKDLVQVTLATEGASKLLHGKGSWMSSAN